MRGVTGHHTATCHIFERRAFLKKLGKAFEKLKPLGITLGDARRDAVRKVKTAFNKVSQKQSRREKALWKAVEKRDVKKVASLLDAETVQNLSDKTAHKSIIWAIHERDAELARTLLEKGVKPDIRDETGNTPLIYAASDNQPEIVTALLKAGADVNAKNNRGSDALVWAYIARHREVMKILVEGGADAGPLLESVEQHKKPQAGVAKPPEKPPAAPNP